jgi:hypothetical protein
MKILIGIAYTFSVLFILFTCLLGLFRLFLGPITITNQLDKEIFVTPYGRIRCPETTTLHLEFSYPGMPNPFNKNINLKPNEDITIYIDHDACLLDGLLVRYRDSMYSVSNDKEPTDSINITNADLKEKISLNITNDKFLSYFEFIIEIFLLGYAPIMTIIISIRKFYKWRQRKLYSSKENAL